jgi:hypothetical protein
MTDQSAVRRRSQKISALWLIGCTSLFVALSLVLVPSAHHAAGAQAPPDSSPWDIRQEPMVFVTVDVRGESDVALLQSLGYACPVGACSLELHARDEAALMALGLPVQVVEKAIRLSGTAPVIAAETFEFGANYSDYYISDGAGSGCGSTTHSAVAISGAPSGAVVTKVKYTLRIEHEDVDDLEVWLQNFFHSQTVWDVAESPGDTDGGRDDDPEDDRDIELWRTIYATFDGDQVNQTWWLNAHDCNRNGELGSYDYWQIYVYYDCTGLAPGAASAPSPADGTTNQSLATDLDWADAARAQSYNVHFGTYSPPPEVATVTSSNYNLEALSPGTHYYWKIVTTNKCGETSSAIWDFTTGAAATATATRTRTPTLTQSATPTTTATATPTRTPAAQPTRTASLSPFSRRLYLPLLVDGN